MEYLLAAVLGGFLVFNATVTPGRAEREVAKVLQAHFPEAEVDVEIEGRRGRDVLKGRFQKVDVAVSNIDNSKNNLGFAVSAVPDAKNKGRLGETTIELSDILWDGIKVESIDVSVKDLVYDFSALKDDSELKIVSSGPVQAKLVVPAAALQNLLLTRMPEVEDPKITLQNDRITINGRRALPIVRVMVDFAMSGKLEARHGNELWVTDPKLSFQNAPAVAVPAGPLTAGLNPLYVADKEKQWPYRVQITSVQARNDKLELSATLTFVPAPRTFAPAVRAAPPRLAPPRLAPSRPTSQLQPVPVQ